MRLPLRLLFSVAALASAACAQIQTITVGAAGQSPRHVEAPFGDCATQPLSASRVQYLYDSREFVGVSGPIAITHLSFRGHGDPFFCPGNGTVTWNDCEVRVGVSAADAFLLSSVSTTFDQNWPGGTPPAPAFFGPIEIGGSSWPPFCASIALDCPAVVFDPTAGEDLLIEVRNPLHAASPPTGYLPGMLCADRTDTCHQLIGAINSPTGQFPNILGWIGAATIEITYVPAGGLFADFTADQTTFGAGTTVNFTDNSSTTDCGGITSWAWDFDGDSLIDSTIQDPSFRYDQCGTFDVSLTVTDATGSQTSTETGLITVVQPFAEFYISPTRDSATPMSVQPMVTYQSATSLGANPVYDWDFDGDGVFETANAGPEPIATYTAPGSYDIGVRMTNSCGSVTATRTTYVPERLLCTFRSGQIFREAIDGDGAGKMFDLTVLQPAGITLDGLIDYFDTNTTSTVTLDVYVTPGSYVGNEANPLAWTRIASASATGVSRPFSEMFFDLRGACLPTGSYGVLLYYTSTSGRVVRRWPASTDTNADISIGPAISVPSLFQSVANQMATTWDGCLFYSNGLTAGSYVPVGTGGCPSSTGVVVGNALTGGGVPTYGQPFSVTISNAPPNEPLSFVILGFADLGGLPLDAIGMTGCVLRADASLALPAATDATGVGATAPFLIPNDPRQFGASIWTQPFVRDPAANPFGAVSGAAFKATVGCP